MGQWAGLGGIGTRTLQKRPANGDLCRIMLITTCKPALTNTCSMRKLLTYNHLHCVLSFDMDRSIPVVEKRLHCLSEYFTDLTERRPTLCTYSISVDFVWTPTERTSSVFDH